MPGRQRAAGAVPTSPAARADRARRAFELAKDGMSTRDISAKMKDEGYRQVSHSVVARLIREYAAAVVLPLAKEHVTREFERLMDQRARLDRMRERAQLVLDRFHLTVSHGKVIYLVEPDRETGEIGEPLRDDGPELAAINTMLGIEAMVLKNAEAMAKLFGFNAAAEVNVTVTGETDAAIRALTSEMDARADTAPVDVQG